MRLFFLTAIVLALVGAGGAALAARGSTAATTIRVTEREYHIALSATTAKAGTFTFRVHNAGKIVHKLDLAGAWLKATVRVPSIAPGATRSVTVKLTGGKLSLWCPVPGHAALGMQTSFKVSGGTTSGSGWG
jgi:VCBS repeat-containing protein